MSQIKALASSSRFALALDLGTQMGWAYGDLRELRAESHGSENLDYPKAKTNRELRFVRFRSWLGGFIKKHQVDQVHFEVVMGHGPGSYRTPQVYGGWLATLGLFSYDTNIPRYPHHVKTIKKNITGSGNAGKPAVVLAVKGMGYAPVDDNAADALAVWHLAKSKL